MSAAKARSRDALAAEREKGDQRRATITAKSVVRSETTRDKMLAALRSGKLCRIVVWRLDRLGRTTKGLCELFDELCERGVDLISMKDGFSLASPAGRLHARILASVAEYETEIRAERVALVRLSLGAMGRRGEVARRVGDGESPTIRS